MIFAEFVRNTVCTVPELAERWKCHPAFIYDTLVKGVICAHKPHEAIGPLGLLLDVKSVINAEQIHGLSYFMFGGSFVMADKVAIVRPDQCHKTSLKKRCIIGRG